MRKILLVMRQELFTTFTRPSFLFVAFVVPIAAVVVVGLISIIRDRSGNGSSSAQETSIEDQLDTEGFVDQSGLIRTVYPEQQEYLIPFDSESEALQAMEAGEITAYYVIPENFVEKGEVDYVFPDNKSYVADDQKWVIQRTLNLNLLDGDLELADKIWNPIRRLEPHLLAAVPGVSVVAGEDCSQPGTACESNELIRLMPSLIVILFFIAFMNSSSMLFSSISAEKENRTIEILMLLVQPKQLLTGKILALGIAGLSHTIMWLISIYILLNVSGSTLSLPDNFQFPARILVWGMLFFIGGFGLYASLMAGAGALAPRLKEAGMASFVALFPLFLGYVFGLLAPLVGAAGSALLVFLSIFPLTSPVVMVMRMTDHAVPVWQIVVSLLLLVLTGFYTIRVIAAMFHTQNLLSGQPFSARRYLSALAGRR